MGHVVHHRDDAGERHLEEVASLEAALARVETLTDAHGSTEVRVFREVPIEVRTVHKAVVLPDDGDGTGMGAPVQRGESELRDEPPPGAMPLSVPPVNVRPDLDEPDANGSGHEPRRAIFGRH
jgi:hypothetical protein